MKLKPETEFAINGIFFLLLSSLGGISVWRGDAWWALACFVFALTSLGSALSAAVRWDEEQKKDEDAEPPVGQ